MIIKSIDRLNIKQYFHYFSNVETETFQKIESRDEFRAWLAQGTMQSKMNVTLLLSAVDQRMTIHFGI